jgi:hypothetical protein
MPKSRVHEGVEKIVHPKREPDMRSPVSHPHAIEREDKRTAALKALERVPGDTFADDAKQRGDIELS